MIHLDKAGPTGNQKILQIHPTRRCNLRCLHCYSLSSPAELEELDSELIRHALSDAASDGYTIAGFSGGEPTLYKPLRELLEHARNSGMITTVTSNGTLLSETRLTKLQNVLNLLAISLDGVPRSHDRVRGREGTFARMKLHLNDVRNSGIPFGFIFTLTQFNVHELDWIAEFAIEQGASLLQIHPLEETGRAKELLAGARPDPIESSFAYLEAVRIQDQCGETLTVHVDLADRDALRAYPARAFADNVECDPECALLAHLVSPLIIEADGCVVPVQYGFSRRFALGNLHQRRLKDLANRWRKERYPAFRELCRRVFHSSTAAAALPFFNWYEAISKEASQPDS